jgi:uncharacterized cofD-like protein
MIEKKIVVIGGGSGTRSALLGLKHHTKKITAVVSMADDGGSSGILRDEFGHLPPGDVRKCLIALSTDDEVERTLAGLLQYRFDKGNGLKDHSFGNLFLTALTELTGSEELAIIEASRILNIRGRVVPVSIDNVRLNAILEDGTLIKGEHNIDVRSVKPDVRIRQIFLSPKAVAYRPAADAIREADVLVIGPGDLYTSVLPTLIVKGIPEAIRDCKGARIYVCNLMTKHGETDGFKASDFMSEVVRYLGEPDLVDAMLVSNEPVPHSLLPGYRKEKAEPVEFDMDACSRLAGRVYPENVAFFGDVVRHDPRKLASAIMRIADEHQATADASIEREVVASNANTP